MPKPPTSTQRSNPQNRLEGAPMSNNQTDNNQNAYEYNAEDLASDPVIGLMKRFNAGIATKEDMDTVVAIGDGTQKRWGNITEADMVLMDKIRQAAAKKYVDEQMADMDAIAKIAKEMEDGGFKTYGEMVTSDARCPQEKDDGSVVVTGAQRIYPDTVISGTPDEVGDEEMEDDEIVTPEDRKRGADNARRIAAEMTAGGFATFGDWAAAKFGPKPTD